MTVPFAARPASCASPTSASLASKDVWPERSDGSLASVGAGLIDEGAKSGPHGRAPACAAELRLLAVQNNETARVGVGGRRDVRHAALCAAGQASAGLIAGPVELNARAA